MIIGQVSHRFYPSVGGIESYVFRLARDLSKEGHEVQVFTTTPSPTQPVFPNVTTRSVPCIPITSSNPFPIGLNRILRRSDVELLHFHSPWYFTSIWPLLRHVELPVVMTVHGTLPERPTIAYRAGLAGLTPFARRAVSRCSAIIALSARESRRIQRVFRVQPDRVHVVSNGIDLHACPPMEKVGARDFESRAHRVLFVGRATRDSRVRTLLSAWSIVANRHPESELFLAGPGTAELERDPVIREMIHNRQLRPLGVVSTPRLCELYSSCGAFVSLGNWEGVPTRILEAMFHKCVPITTPAGGVPDVVSDGVNGILLSATDEQSISHSIEKLMEDPQLLAKLGNIAHETVVRNHDWTRIFRSILGIYEGLIGG